VGGGTRLGQGGDARLVGPGLAGRAHATEKQELGQAGPQAGGEAGDGVRFGFL
jgi:hypothetical protein